MRVNNSTNINKTKCKIRTNTLNIIGHPNYKLIYLTRKHSSIRGIGLEVMVFNATFDNISVISWRSVLLMNIDLRNTRKI